MHSGKVSKGPAPMSHLTVHSLFDAYPNITHAVSYVELIVCGHEDGEESSWELLMRSLAPLDVVLDCIKEAANGEITRNIQLARAEMDHPEFVTYLRGKMGLCLSTAPSSATSAI